MNRKQFEAKFLDGLIFGKWREMLDALHEADNFLNGSPVPECVHDAWVRQVSLMHDGCLREGAGDEIFYLTTGVFRLWVGFDGKTLKTELLGANDDVRRKWEGE